MSFLSSILPNRSKQTSSSDSSDSDDDNISEKGETQSKSRSSSSDDDDDDEPSSNNAEAEPEEKTDSKDGDGDIEEQEDELKGPIASSSSSTPSDREAESEHEIEFDVEIPQTSDSNADDSDDGDDDDAAAAAKRTRRDGDSSSEEVDPFDEPGIVPVARYIWTKEETAQLVEIVKRGRFDRSPQNVRDDAIRTFPHITREKIVAKIRTIRRAGNDSLQPKQSIAKKGTKRKQQDEAGLPKQRSVRGVEHNSDSEPDYNPSTSESSSSEDEDDNGHMSDVDEPYGAEDVHARSTRPPGHRYKVRRAFRIDDKPGVDISTNPFLVNNQDGVRVAHKGAPHLYESKSLIGQLTTDFKRPELMKLKKLVPIQVVEGGDIVMRDSFAMDHSFGDAARLFVHALYQEVIIGACTIQRERNRGESRDSHPTSLSASSVAASIEGLRNPFI